MGKEIALDDGNGNIKTVISYDTRVISDTLNITEIKGEFIVNFKLWIYNRWGEQVYYTSNITDYWDGTYKGLPAKIDGYIWRIEYSDYNLNEGKLKGHINLLR